MRAKSWYHSWRLKALAVAVLVDVGLAVVGILNPASAFRLGVVVLVVLAVWEGVVRLREGAGE